MSNPHEPGKPNGVGSQPLTDYFALFELNADSRQSRATCGLPNWDHQYQSDTGLNWRTGFMSLSDRSVDLGQPDAYVDVVGKFAGDWWIRWVLTRGLEPP